MSLHLFVLLAFAVSLSAGAGCNTAQDMKAFQANWGNWTQVMQNCGTSCYESQSDCEACLGKAPGLTAPCSDCFYQDVQCSVHNCFSCYLQPTCKSCIDCTTSHCTPPLLTCAQVGANALPPAKANC